MLQIHLNDGYETSWGNARANNPYNFQYIPTTFTDSVIEHTGAFPLGTYQNDINTRLAVPTDVTIQMAGESVGGFVYRVRAQVCIEEGGSPKTLRIQTVQVLDNYPPDAVPYRNCVKTGAPSIDVAVNPGRCTIIERDLTFDTTSIFQAQNIRIIMWAENPTTPLEVYNAAVMPWPFPPDCNLNGVPDATDISNGTSDDVNGDGIPDECQDLACAGDTNCDGQVDFGDINSFVAALTEGAYCDDGSNADVDGNGGVGFEDINPFVTLLTGGGLPIPCN